MICLPMISPNAPFKSAKYFTDSITIAACEVHVKDSPRESNLGTKARWPQAWDAPWQMGSASCSPGRVWEDHVKNQRLWPISSGLWVLALLSPLASCPASVVFLQTPHKLLTAQQNSEPSVPCTFPTPFLPYNCHLWLSFKISALYITRC